jgi:hypothetical protein
LRRSAPAIALELAPSRALRAGLVVAGAIAALAVLTSGLGVSFAYVCVALAVILVLRGWRSTSRHAGSRLALMPDGTWSLRDARGAERVLDLRAATDLGFLFALTFGDGRQRIRVPIVADTVDADIWRQLRVWLRDAHAIGGFTDRA